MRIPYSQVILVLVNLCIRWIEICIYGRERRQRRAHANDRTRGNVADEGQIRIDAQLARGEVELAPIENAFVGYDFTGVGKS